jgi:hypothetical protein
MARAERAGQDVAVGGDLQSKSAGGGSLVADAAGGGGAANGVAPGKQTLTEGLGGGAPAAGAAQADGASEAEVAAAVAWGKDVHHAPGPETLAALQTALGVAKSDGYDAALARAVFLKQKELGDKHPDAKAGPSFCGKIGVSFAKAKPAKGGAAAKGDDPGKLHLQTALDSRVSVSKAGNGYVIAIDLPKRGECIQIGEYESLASDPSLRELPIYIEDIVTDDRALVRIKYDAARVRFTQHAHNEMTGTQPLTIQATAVPAEELKIAAGPKAKKAAGGYVAEGTEKVTSHSGGSELDKVMGAVASAEGGFASTEGSDKGIFTWGQGQWTVGADLLQPVLGFIKAQRQDLFDRYFGAAELDVKGTTLYWKGKPYAGKPKLKELFHANDTQNKYFVDVFSQAGQDPQIQRLQREYQRQETHDKLNEEVGGHVPDKWLNTRGKAFYYSMWVNAPTYSSSFFKEAIAAKAGSAKEPTPAMIEAVSQNLEDQFKDSGVIAKDDKNHNIIAFWGERGRQKAIDEADKHIANPALDSVWTKEQWQTHKEKMQKRESRYQKTKADIDTALTKQSVEPDVPADAKVYFE